MRFEKEGGFETRPYGGQGIRGITLTPTLSHQDLWEFRLWCVRKLNHGILEE